MSTQELLDSIAALVADHERGAAAFGTDPDPLAVNIRTLLTEHAKRVEAKKDSREAWAAEVSAAADVARERIGGELGKRLELILNTGAGFVRHGSDLGGGMMSYRFKSLAEAVANTPAGARDAVINAAATLREGGNDLFRSGQATAARYCWKAEDALRTAFGLTDPDAAPATSAPEKKE